ncbi:armadillo-type protein [Phycomyces blakesleeanus]
MDTLPNTGGKHRLKSTTRGRLHSKRSIPHLSRTKLASTPASPTTPTLSEKQSIDPKPAQQASHTLSTASFIRHNQELSSNLQSLGRSKAALPRNGVQLTLPHWKDQETSSSSCSVDSRLQARTTSLGSTPKIKEKPTEDPHRPSDQEIERRFRLASKDYLHTNLVDISNLSNDRKWWLLCNQKEFTKLFSNTTKKRQNGLTRARSRTNLKDTAPKVLTPQAFLRPFLADNRSGITLRLVKDLEAQLRTSSLGWIRQFIEENGMRIIIKELGMINNNPAREQKNYLIELGIIKCLRPMFNHIIGIQEALSDPFCSIHLILSLLSPYIPARTAACDALTFLCYCDVPTGHSMVLRGMDHLTECSHEYGRFDSWLKALDSTLENRGKMGSLVGANKDLWQTEVIGTPSSPEAHLMEYALSNMLLVNAILDPDTVEDFDSRMAFRNQLHQSGLSQILVKMNSLNYEKLNEKIFQFKDLEDFDSASLYGGLVVGSVIDPADVLDKVLATIRGTHAYESLQNTLNHLLLIQCDPEKRNRYYQLIDSIVCEIVLDHKNSPQEFLDDYTSSVHDMIARYTKGSPPDETTEENNTSLNKSIEREKELQRQINLGAGGLVGQLNCKIDSLEEALKASNLANIALKQRLSDLEIEFQNTLEATDAQIKRLYDTVREQTEYGSPTDKRRRVRGVRKPKIDGDTRPLSISSILLDESLHAEALTESPIEVTSPLPPTQSQSQPHPHPQPNPSSGNGKPSLRVSIGSRMSNLVRRSTQPEISPVPKKPTSPKINGTPIIEGSLPPQAKLRYSEDQLPTPSATKSTSLLVRRSNRASHPGRSRLSDAQNISNVKEEEPLSASDTVDMLLKKLYEDSDHDNASSTSIAELLSAPTTPLITPAATSSAKSTEPSLTLVENMEDLNNLIEHPTTLQALQDTLNSSNTTPNSPTIIFSTSEYSPELPVVLLEPPPPPPPAPPAPPPPPPPPPSTPFMSPSSSLVPPKSGRR